MESKTYKGEDRRDNEIWIRNSDNRRCCSKEKCLMVYKGYGLCDTHYRHALKRGEISLDKIYNTYTKKEGYVEITVNNSEHIFKIDVDKVEYAKQRNWYVITRRINGNEYPYLVAKETIDGKSKVLKFHIEIMKNEIDEFKNKSNYNKRIVVDHKNGITTDNRKNNLRVRTQSENNMNKEIQSNNTSGVVGVSWNKKAGAWDVKISKNNKVYNVGTFYYFRNAVKERISQEERLFGEHSLRKREDNDYDKYIEHILSLPEIQEPIFRKRPENEFDMLGIRRKKNGKYEGYIYIKETQLTNHKTFDNLNDAIKWRKEKEVEIHGQIIRYHDEKEEKLI